MGPPTGLEEETEQNLVAYTDYCRRMAMPKTQIMLSGEIVHFLQVRQLQNKFRTKKPGKILHHTSFHISKIRNSN